MLEISLHVSNIPISASFKFSIASPLLNYSFSSGHITSSPISTPKLQFHLRPHYIQSHSSSQSTVSAQATLHPVLSLFLKYNYSSGHITTSPISIPKLQFQLRPHYIQSHLHSQTTVSAQATLHPVPSPFPNCSFSSGYITSSPLHSRRHSSPYCCWSLW